MKNSILRVLVLVGAIFPFAMVGYKLFEEESLITAGFYTALIVVLFATVYIGWRTQPASPDAETSQDGREITGRS